MITIIIDHYYEEKNHNTNFGSIVMSLFLVHLNAEFAEKFEKNMLELKTEQMTLTLFCIFDFFTLSALKIA